MKRYNNTPVLAGGSRYGTASLVHSIRLGISSGNISVTEMNLTELQRLDVLAGIYYGDSSMWWIIAAASNVGWGLQVPPGTLIKIPNLEAIRNLV